MILTVDHPVPVIVTAPRVAGPRVALRRGQTPVRLVEVDEGEMRPYQGEPNRKTFEWSPPLRGGCPPTDLAAPLFEGGGRLWLRADRTSQSFGATSDMRFLAKRRELEVALGTGHWTPGTRRSLLFDMMVGTPPTGPEMSTRTSPASRHELGPASPVVPWVIGGKFQPGARIVEDFADAAASAVRERVEEGIRICNGQVFLAFEGVHALVVPRQLAGPGRRACEAVTLAPRRMLRAFPDAFLVRTDRKDALAWAERSCGSPGRPVPSHRRAGASPRAWGDADVMLHAHALPLRVWRDAASRPDLHPEGSLEPLLPHLARGLVAAATRVGAEDALALCAALSRLLSESADPGTCRAARRASLVVGYVMEVGLPALWNLEPVGPEDGLALQGL